MLCKSKHKLLMNKFYIFFLICCCPYFVLAQKKNKQDYVFQKGEGIVLDGQLDEWEGRMYNAESEVWSFGISIDGDKLYAAVRIKDDMLQHEALRNGIFVNLSYNEKKKDGAKLLYPYVDGERLRALSQDENLDLTEIKAELLKSVRGYQISGFSKVVDGLLSLDNSYEVRAKAQLYNGVLLYEAEIPLDLISFKSDRIGVQVGINTSFFQTKKVVDASPRGNNVRIYGRSPVKPTIKNPYSEETVVWFLGNIK